jgi:hypothetical protein
MMAITVGGFAVQIELELPRGRERQVLWARLGLAAVLSTVASCFAVAEPVHEVNGIAETEDIYATEEPPPPRSEVVVGVAPGPSYIWVGGYWTRHRDGWFWVGGRWAARPHQNAVWEQGRWDRHPRGYIRVRGRWR